MGRPNPFKDIQITRTLKIPDPVRLELFRRCPDLGPKLLFFSGGTALRKTSSELIRYTHNSIHVITPFDSGGSSALLREAFKMPAIGDVRNRLLALADRTLHGFPEIFSLFARRFPIDGDPVSLADELDEMIAGNHPLVAQIPDPMRKIIRRHFGLFKKFMPDDFDLRKASLGNLILTAGYIDNARNFDTIIYIFSNLVRVRGTVRPVVNKYLHLVTELEDGTVIAGQHLLTGKETETISSKVRRVYLAEKRENPEPAKIGIRTKMRKLIGQADLICYPVGSFYSSLIANLLPAGVGRSVAANPCPKVFVPNTGCGDPEAFGMTLEEQIRTLCHYLKQDNAGNISTGDILNFVLVDLENGQYPGKFNRDSLKGTGIEIVSTPLVSLESAPFIDEKLLVPALLSLA